MKTERVNALIFASVYPHYVKKVETKGRTLEELDEVIRWLTGYSKAGLEKQLKDRVDLFPVFGNESDGLDLRDPWQFTNFLVR